MKRIADKQEFYQLSRHYQMGNRLIQWTSDEFESLYRDLETRARMPKIIGVRHVGRAFQGGNSFRTTRSKAYEYLKWHYKDRFRILFDEAAHDPWITIQGEVMNDHQGLYFRYSHKKCHQRELWVSGEYSHVQGLRASLMLQHYLDPDSWEFMNQMFREYDAPVIEFTAFDRPVGVLGWLSLIWECRTDY